MTSGNRFNHETALRKKLGIFSVPGGIKETPMVNAGSPLTITIGLNLLRILQVVCINIFLRFI